MKSQLHPHPSSTIYTNKRPFEPAPAPAERVISEEDRAFSHSLVEALGEEGEG